MSVTTNTTPIMKNLVNGLRTASPNHALHHTIKLLSSRKNTTSNSSSNSNNSNRNRNRNNNSNSNRPLKVVLRPLMKSVRSTGMTLTTKGSNSWRYISPRIN
jgi:hypothetical protein